MVEDHATLAGRIAQGLSQAGMAVDAVYDGALALELNPQNADPVQALRQGKRIVEAMAGACSD